MNVEPTELPEWFVDLVIGLAIVGAVVACFVIAAGCGTIVHFFLEGLNQ